MIAGLVERHLVISRLTLTINAFNSEPNGQGQRGQTDHTQMNDWIWERNEIDSHLMPFN